ncbi:MAG: YitT family protein [Desulfobacterales bacterium]|jgi:uncharacterized membrane-anchored protein YitT (DUF2179 family)
MQKNLIFYDVRSLHLDQILQVMKTTFTLILGAVIVAIGFSLFQVPFNLAAGGITGVTIIVRDFFDLPSGVLYLILNLPLMTIGYRSLGQWQFLIRTILSVLVFSVATDILSYTMPRILANFPMTSDMLLSSIYAGLITGIGSGLIYRAGGTIGGTSVITRIIQRKTGIPLSQLYLIVDGTIILLAVFTFGWEIALHAILVLMIGGIASDFALEGPSVVRTASIVTDQPRELADELMGRLHRGVSIWEITGGYTGQKRSMVFCTVNRAQIFELKQVVSDVNPDAFVVIGNAQQALGTGFQHVKRRKAI